MVALSRSWSVPVRSSISLGQHADGEGETVASLTEGAELQGNALTFL